MSLVGLTKEQIEKALANKDRAELVAIIYHLATVETQISPQELANRRQLSKQSILRLIKQGRLPAHKPFPSVLRISASAIADWDEKTRV
jgi:excisionase family DNA binding protein